MQSRELFDLENIPTWLSFLDQLSLWPHCLSGSQLHGKPKKRHSEFRQSWISCGWWPQHGIWCKYNITATNKFNLDIKNMLQIPNLSNSKTLSVWCETGFTFDIFRHFYPDHIIFSHVQFNKNDHSRSRIDHFLCSPNFVKSFFNLTYLPITTKLFDHKRVLLVPAM